MKKIIVILIAFAFTPFTSIGATDNENVSNEKTEITKSNNNDNDWQPIGTMEIFKIVGSNAAASKKVQVYKNSNGTRAVKDKYGYHEIEDNPEYGRFPSDECPVCGFPKRVFFESSYWYTKGIVKQTYGSY